MITGRIEGSREQQLLGRGVRAQGQVLPNPPQQPPHNDHPTKTDPGRIKGNTVPEYPHLYGRRKACLLEIRLLGLGLLVISRSLTFTNCTVALAQGFATSPSLTEAFHCDKHLHELGSLGTLVSVHWSGHKVSIMPRT